MPGRLAALDVGIISPDAGGAGRDCTEAMVRVKKEKYANYEEELERGNVTYCPIVWSAYGRPHAEALQLMRTVAKKNARLRGLGDHRAEENHLRSRITTEIWRRTARMVAACRPDPGDDDDTECDELKGTRHKDTDPNDATSVP